jgi:glucose/mannose-6-phosphate isomerase
MLPRLPAAPMGTAAETGLARMRALAADLPTALLAGYRGGRELGFPNGVEAARIFVVGMGASGIAAELARGVLDRETTVVLRTVRSGELPRGLGREARVVVVSYSGNTWEALRAYEAAGRSGVSRTVVTSGGSLAERAETDDVPVLRVPPGMPPRSAVGHLLGGLLGLLDASFPESNDARLARISERVRGLIGSYTRARGPATTVAAAIGERLPFVMAESDFAGLARRWATQIEENAKRLASFEELPEMLHNQIVGWDGIGRAEARQRAVLLLDWAASDPTVRKSLAYLERLLEGRGVRVVRVPLASDDRLEALVGGVALGDHVSLAIAERAGVDPYPVEAITRLKAAIGDAAPRRTPGRARAATVRTARARLNA